jgi:hypothetical protein
MVRLYVLGFTYATDLTAIGTKVDLLKLYQLISEKSYSGTGIKVSYAMWLEALKDLKRSRKEVAQNKIGHANKISLPLAILLDSELNNFPRRRVAGSLYVEVSGFVLRNLKGACCSMSKSLPAEILISFFENGSLVIFVLIYFDSELTVHETIDLIREVAGEVEGNGIKGGALELEAKTSKLHLRSQQLVVELLELLGIRGKAKERDLSSLIVDTYAYTYVQSGQLTDEQVYGLADLDWTFEEANENTIKHFISQDVSMLKGIRSIITLRSNLTLYAEEPQSYVEGITGLPSKNVKDELARHLKGIFFLGEKSLYFNEQDQYAYEWIEATLEYMVNTKPLRLRVLS